MPHPIIATLSQKCRPGYSFFCNLIEVKKDYLMQKVTVFTLGNTTWEFCVRPANSTHFKKVKSQYLKRACLKHTVEALSILKIDHSELVSFLIEIAFASTYMPIYIILQKVCKIYQKGTLTVKILMS